MSDNSTDNKHLEILYKGYNYSSEQFDKAILFVSSGSLVLSTTFIEKIVPLNTSICKEWLLFSWILEAITIILFTVNHYISMIAFNKSIKNVNESTVINLHAKAVTKINITSIVTLLGGLISLIIFIYININLNITK
jgi:hypothetical protein